MTIRGRRGAGLDDILEPAGLDALLVTNRSNVRYLSGFTGSSGVLLHPVRGVPTLVTDFRYEEQASQELDPRTRTKIGREGWAAAIADEIGDTDWRVGFESEDLTVAHLDRLEEALPSVEWLPTRDLVERMRATKVEEEVAAIQAAARLAEHALERLLVGVDWYRRPTEKAIATRLEFELKSGGSGALPFDIIIASGPRSSLPHATPSDRAVETGDFVLIDFGARVDGYCCDITRTFVIGAPTAWQLEMHDRVLEANRAAVATVGPGVACAAVDAAARDLLAEHDLDEHFGHSTGHGIGLDIHESPSLSTRSEAALEPGNVVTVEPGVYLPARGGVRIEDDVLVTPDGHRTLTRFPRELGEL